MSANKRVSFLVVTETVVKANNKKEAAALARTSTPTFLDVERISAKDAKVIVESASK